MMKISFLGYLFYVLPFVIVLLVYQRRQKEKDRRFRQRLKATIQAGLTEPPSLHPVIDASRCVGCGTCVPACPEKAIGVVKGKGMLVEPAHCIGHGACQAACPMDAIQLVFGTEQRGMDIPQIHPNFETNVPGIFIAGELGGMGLIRKAVEQGKQAIESIAKKTKGPHELEVCIVGAGPAGLSASLGAKEKRLRFITIDQEDSFGGSVYHYPRNKLTMTAPVVLPLVGKIKMYEISKEDLLGIWARIIGETGLTIQFNERLESLVPLDRGGFQVTTSKGQYYANNIVLALGRRGSPRKLGVPGEEQPKVVYRLIDAEQYRGSHVLVVGGGDSAIEAALALSEEVNTTVTLSYRSEAFSRLKPKNRERLQHAESHGKLTVLLKSNIQKIEKEKVVLEQDGTMIELPNDSVIVCAGGILPTPFLKEIGVMVETHHGLTRLKDRQPTF